MRKFSRVLSIILAVLVVLLGSFVFEGEAFAAGDTVTINVYNWGQYISDGTDGYIDVIAEFEAAYPDIKVNYMTYDTNESMYTKLQTGGASYDVIFPSDYMVEKLIEEDMLLELDLNNIPNFEYIDEEYRNMIFDPGNRYSVPYTWSYSAIIYNSRYVNEEDLTGWDIMWNPTYAGKILMYDTPREAYGIAEILLGIDVNTEDPDELARATEKLKEQKPLVQSYVMDQIYDKMDRAEAWVAAYFAGDYLMMAVDNEDLQFFVPEEGFNYFVDNMCIPKCAEHKEEAEIFINFLCDPEISGQNMEYLGYASPETAARDYMDPEVASDEITFPPEEVLSHGVIYQSLSVEGTQLMNELWLSVKTDDNTLGLYLWVTGGAIVLVVALWLILGIRKKRRIARRGTYKKDE